ncbi:MAG TPA: hypothetical protein VNC78_12705 [Actinomycetota bacterium]|nr:hypothetical protein [Actinomycetota bacterium]
MSQTRLTPRPAPAERFNLRWDSIVIDLTPTDIMVDLDPPLVLTSK